MTPEQIAAWPGVDEGFSPQYRLGHHAGWRDAMTHIDTLMAALRETTKAFHALNWHDRPVFGRRGYTFETCPIERCVTNRAILNGEPHDA